MSSKNVFYKAPRYLFRKLNILSLIKNINPDSFVDVGCGAGELACSLVQKFDIKGVGIDFSQDAIKTARGIQKSRHIPTDTLNFYQDNGKALKKERHDLVICCEVLEHVENDAEMLKKLVSSSNRFLIISVPAKQRLFDSSDLAVGHFRRYEKQPFIDLLESNNLNIIQFVSYGFPFTNLVRLLRKIFFIMKFSSNNKDSMESRSKESGINPVKMPGIFSRIDFESYIKPFYYISRLFNSFNLSEGYLVLCEKKTDV